MTIPHYLIIVIVVWLIGHTILTIIELIIKQKIRKIKKDIELKCLKRKIA